MDSVLDFLSDFPWVIVLVFLALIALICVGVYQNEKTWEQYAQDHHCQKVGTKDGGLGLGIGSNGGTVTVVNPDQTIYKCDNEELVIR